MWPPDTTSGSQNEEAMPDAAAMLLFPGAGSSSHHSSLVALERSLAPLPVARADFPYRKEGRRAPDRAPKLLAAVREEAAALAERTGADPAAVVLGGRSMGGRMCSLAVAGETPGDPGDRALPAAGLVLISYPLHPPGKPDKLRVEHFPRLRCPCLFVCGTRDPFGTPEELESHTAAIPGQVTHVWLDGAGHELKGADGQIVDAVRTWLAG
jgi:uncharacterized protein